MTDLQRIRWGRWLSGTAVILAMIGLGVLVGRTDWYALLELPGLLFAMVGIGFGALAWVTLPAQPGNAAIWTYAWSALCAGLVVVGVALMSVFLGARLEAIDSGTIAPADVPVAAGIGLLLLGAGWIPAFNLVFTRGLLLFPDGELSSIRLRWLDRLIVVATVVATGSAAILFLPSSTVPADTFDTRLGAVVEMAVMLLGLTAIASAVALGSRYRRSDPIVRTQIRWVALGGFVLIASVLVNLVLQGGLGDDGIGMLALSVPVGLFVASFWVAITKHRLYDIDLVVSRSLTFGALAVFIGAVYVAIVVVVGALVGQGDQASFGLSIVATAFVALAFQPVRRRVERVANRIVFGERATPYEVLADFSRRAAEAPDDGFLERVPRLIVDGTGADRAALWVHEGAGFNAVASWPDGATTEILGDEFHDPEADLSLPVFHDGELLGGVSLHVARGETITPPEARLLDDLVAGLGIALRNARLTENLRHQVEELERSRDRVVTAADRARRSLEHQLDSGPQQQLVALKVKLGPIRKMAEQAGAVKSVQVLRQLESAAGDAITAVRDFAGGVYPPLLEAEGLVVALGNQTRRAALPVTVDAAGVTRYPREVEAAVYFAILEALQNSTKYAGADGVTVSLVGDDYTLTFEVVDDGAGFDLDTVVAGSGLANMGDRIDSVGGTFEIESAVGSGTTVRGSIPLAEKAVSA